MRRRGEPDGRTANSTDTKLGIDKNSRKTNTVARPGGGESDAAFTPSPPVVLQSENQSIALSLAHQTRIRNLYSHGDPKSDLRPDSSSSTSSATDWDNGHATVLRRQAQAQPPPVPPPRTKPLVDLVSLTPLYNNLPASFENSSDSELEKVEAIFPGTTQRPKAPYRKSRNAMSTLDRLSVRTEVTPQQNVLMQGSRKLVPLPNEESASSNERLLYFSPNDSLEISQVKVAAEKEEPTQDIAKNEVKGQNSALHDAILATQLRHINRELTPTISDVYHERNIGLGLAPPLAKLLLNQSQTTAPQTDSSVLDKINLGILEEGNGSGDSGTNDQCMRCKLELGLCTCKPSKANKPWLTESVGTLQQIQSSDLTTADILEREVKNKMCLR